MHNILTIPSNIINYTVQYANSLAEVEEFIESQKAIVVIDELVAQLYPTLCTPDSIRISAIETNKTLQGASDLSQLLIDRRANIKTKLIAIGGGIIQDLVGFTASIYCRGIDYIYIPTTLLSQADSCIGGKTSINHANRKNILGTFYPPETIILYPGFVNTLTTTDYFSGWGEIYKFHILQGMMSDFSLSNAESSIINGLSYKANILALDEFDQGERRYLNFGHTFGHALETTSNHAIPHGLAVILGCMIATKVAYKMGYVVKDHNLILSEGIRLIRLSGLKLQQSWFESTQLLEVVKSDKKSTGELVMVLVDSKPNLVNIKNLGIVIESLNEVYESI